MANPVTLQMVWDKLSGIQADQASLRADLVEILALLRELTELARDTAQIVTTPSPGGLRALHTDVKELADRVDALEGATQRVLQ